jgi:hypothetical protein
VTVIATVRTLMARAIDYAGLFPPARLSLESAVGEYLSLHRDTAAWMLARFVCPAARLDELVRLWPSSGGPLLAVAAIGSGGATTAELAERIRDDAEAIAAVAAAAGRRAVVDQVELRLPADLLAARDAGAVRQVVAELHGTLHRGAPVAVLLVLEAPLAGASLESLRAVLGGIERFNRDAIPAGHLPVCIKLRCGGLEAAAVPSIGELATAIAAARDHTVPIKATQGLHHALPRFDAALGVRTHGFVNLLAAAILARAARLGEDEIAALLAEDDPARFRFADDELAWASHRVSLAEVAAGRRHAIVSFGSCSFTDPRGDLAALGLLAG